MLSFESLLAFVVASVFLALAPGPDNLFVLTQSALSGLRAGLLVTVGLCTGLIVHTFAVAVGVAALISTSTWAFSLLKFVGAGYLVYLAWLSFRAKPDAVVVGEKTGLSGAKLYRRGIIMNVTNPKVSIFFLAFLPQFADPARGSVTLQLIALGGLFILVTLVVFGGVAALASKLNAWFTQSRRGQQILNRIAGAVFVGLAVKLATARL
ncbi:LysE family translocator [Rhodopirellula sallentina]|uniref:Lysine exporter protein LysE/YggA n=1 Tax=Rhodopirellula sallentina SM41 TaxID=1263870 RepID=M5TRS3_9BACT|nr:LysE family transporter [Rhodopirellula sallentina]EMI51887.1 lysine exporter protein LysE/YggA [Rhodopirellula sallentina SM41]